jgi:hypothetical protein
MPDELRFGHSVAPYGDGNGDSRFTEIVSCAYDLGRRQA